MYFYTLQIYLIPYKDLFLLGCRLWRQTARKCTCFWSRVSEFSYSVERKQNLHNIPFHYHSNNNSRDAVRRCSGAGLFISLRAQGSTGELEIRSRDDNAWRLIDYRHDESRGASDGWGGSSGFLAAGSTWHIAVTQITTLFSPRQEEDSPPPTPYTPYTPDAHICIAWYWLYCRFGGTIGL